MASVPVFLRLSLRHIQSQPRRSLLTVGGLALGTCMLCLSLSLGLGVRTYVLDQLLQTLPADMIEVSAKGIDLGFLQMPAGGLLGGATLDAARIEQLRQLPHVKAAFPKRDVSLPLGAQGGDQLFGRPLYTDLFVTAVPQALVQGASAPLFIDLDQDAKVLTDDAVIPLVIAPQLIALYNAQVAPALGTPLLEAQHLVGLRFDLVIGRSLMQGARKAQRRGVQKAIIVGVSPFAAPLGATMPWRYAEALMARYAAFDPAEKTAQACSSVIIQCQSAQDIVGVTDAMARAGLQVSPLAQRIRNILWGATALLTSGAVMVLALATSQAAFAAFVYVAERRKQWAILQALGLPTRSLVATVLVQALWLGALGGLLGLALGVGAGCLGDYGARHIWPQGAPLPQSLFDFAPGLMAGCLGAATGASLLGALGPAAAAARTPVHQAFRS